MSPEELELLVERFCFFNLTANEALQVLRDRFDKQTFTEIYSREEREWKATADMNPLAKFPLNDSDQQEAFFQAVEGVCREVDKIQSDYPAYVPPILHPSYVANDCSAGLSACLSPRIRPCTL